MMMAAILTAAATLLLLVIISCNLSRTDTFKYVLVRIVEALNVFWVVALRVVKGSDLLLRSEEEDVEKCRAVLQEA